MITERKREDILDFMLSKISDRYDTSQNSFIHQSLSSAAIEFEEANKELIQTARKFDFWNLYGEELDEGVYQRTGIRRREPLFAHGNIRFTGQDGTFIPEGTIVISDELEFQTLQDATVDGGNIDVDVVSTEPGEVYNIGSGRIEKAKDYIAGVTDVSNLEAFTGGRDPESDESLKERCDKHMKYPPKAGNIYHYEEWISEIPEVYAVRAFRRYQKRACVRCVVIQNTREDGIENVTLKGVSTSVPLQFKPADSDFIQVIKDKIEDLIPFDADLVLEGAKVQPLYISVDLKYESKEAEMDTLKTMYGIVTEYLNSNVFGEGEISHAKIGCLILRTPGVVDYSNLKIGKSKSALGTANLKVGEDEMFIIKEVI